MNVKHSVRRLGVLGAVLGAACFAAEVKLIGPGAPPTGGSGGGGGGPGFTLTIAPPTATIALNTILQLGLTLRDAQGAQVPTGTVTWSSSNTSVIAVDQAGQVRGVALGTAVTTASTAGTAATVTITVVSTPVASVVVTPSTATLQLGSGSQFTAVARDAAGNALPGRAVLWSTSNAAVLTVGQSSGASQAVGVGTVTLTATSEGQSGTATVTVQNVPVASVQVTPPADTVQISQQTQLAATPRDASGNALTGRQIQWASAAPAIARVSGNGLIDGLAAGTATITATSEGRVGSATITVIPIPVAVVVVVPQAVTVQVSATTTFNGTPRDANGNALTGRPISWTSADTTRARVSQTGVVTGVAPGSVLISATVQGVVGSAFVTVTSVAATLVSVTILPQSAALLSGQTQAFSLTGTLSDNSTIPVTGSFQAPGGAINGAGIYTAPDASGTFLVIGTATGTSLRDTATVTVTRPPVATVQVAPSSATVDVGRTLGLTATMRDAAGSVLTNRSVSWVSSNTAVATVNGAGLVTALTVGTTTITATSEGQSASAAITTRLIPVASVAVNPTAASVTIGLQTQLVATCRDAGGAILAGRSQVWSTSASAVASVTSVGVVTALSLGSATITVNCEGPTATAAITVVTAPPATGYPNEPPGSRILFDWDFDISRAGNPPFYYIDVSPATTVTEVTAPVNPSKIGRIEFNSGLQAGTGPSALASNLMPPSNWRTWYHSFWFKTSSNYQNQMSFPGLKIWDMLLGSPNGSIIVQLYGTTSFNMLLSYRWTENSDHYGNIDMQRNTWYQIEILATDVGGGQARYQLFVNGNEDINVVRPRANNVEFIYGWIMGGGPGNITLTSYLYHDHTRFSYTN